MTKISKICQDVWPAPLAMWETLLAVAVNISLILFYISHGPG